jgi:BirA family biotin operon repressor/biotin-[acetyl-CoA-carboxylase] ligase
MSEKKQREELTEESLRAHLGDAARDFSVYVFDEIDSTNTEAKRRAMDGEARAILAARRQSAGRGRMGRSFYSPEDSGVYFSLLMPLEKEFESGVFLTTAVSVAVMRAIRALTGKQVGIKWVNDLYWQGRKVCGILCESMILGNDRSVIIGIGINVRSAEFPPELSDIAGSLSADALSLSELIAEVCKEVFSFLEDPSSPAWLEDYRKHSLVLGKKVRWIENEIAHEGLAESIREDGALCIRAEDGSLAVLRTGEISLRLTQ